MPVALIFVYIFTTNNQAEEEGREKNRVFVSRVPKKRRTGQSYGVAVTIVMGHDTASHLYVCRVAGGCGFVWFDLEVVVVSKVWLRVCGCMNTFYCYVISLNHT